MELNKIIIVVQKLRGIETVQGIELLNTVNEKKYIICFVTVIFCRTIK